MMNLVIHEIIRAGTKMNLRYLAPVRPGDTIRNEAKVIEKKTVGTENIAVIDFACINQKNEKVIVGTWEVVVD